VVEVKAEAERLGIEIVFLPPYSLELNPIEYIWRSTKRVISTTFCTRRGRHAKHYKGGFLSALPLGLIDSLALDYTAFS